MKLTPYECEQLTKLLDAIDIIVGTAKANLPEFTYPTIEVIGTAGHSKIKVSPTMLARLAVLGRAALTAKEGEKP